MALVVLLRGVNVGGRRTFRPAALVQQLTHLGAVNIGAAGTFVIGRPIARARLRDEFARRLPFEADIMICDGRDIVRLISAHAAGGDAASDVVRFVSVLASVPRAAPPVPISLPPEGRCVVSRLRPAPESR
jgi:uncharacterized protein (DUF1697 family)